MQTSKIVFVDFHDSFSYNILSYLKDWGEIHIVHPSEVNSVLKSHTRFIWGPGPGKADEYPIDFNLLRNSLHNSEHRHFGICLGHQLIGLCLGGRYGKEDFPRHGVSHELVLPRWNDWGLNGEQVSVQSYNSLVIDGLTDSKDLRVWRDDQRIVMLASKTVFSCQFHPESVGTSYPELFFGGVKKNFL